MSIKSITFMTCAFIATQLVTMSPDVAMSVRLNVASPRDHPSVEVVGLSREQAEMVDGSVALFAEAGLVLPSLVVQASADVDACSSHPALHRSHGSWSQI